MLAAEPRMRFVILSCFLTILTRPAFAAEPDLATRAAALLRDRCVRCHGAKESNGGLRLDQAESVRRGGDSGPSVVQKKPAESLLLRRVVSMSDDEVMPPEGDRLTADEVRLLTEWITAGAEWPAQAVETAKAGSDWWAIQPLRRPAVPVAAIAGDANGRSNPIDAFITEALVQQGLQRSSSADRRTLMRRVALDLTGLLPTIEEIEAFERDPDPLAYERLVDRLLASPRYGERWARHWLDVVHFAETHGHDQDRPRDHAWPYRDYVIESLNVDKPYARFVEEQVAADALHPDDPTLVRALGFLSAGPWDESSLRDIREETIDRQIGRYLDRDDIVTNVMSTFTSTTVHCARCHHHKFDPISQEDYFSLQAVFAGTEKGTRPFDLDAATRTRRAELAQLDADLKRNSFSLPEPLLESMRAWEENQRAHPATWLTLSSPAVTSENGATLRLLDDGSCLVSGKSPEVDTYTVSAELPATPVTGLQLEVLPHESLAHQGPGRQDNGNLHLSEIRVLFRAEGGETEQPVSLRNPVADFDQAGWDITRALDGNVQSAWGIYPEVGKAHAAVFEVVNPPSSAGTWTIHLDQRHGGRHTIGRFRLSITTTRGAALQAAVTSSTVAALSKAPADRSPEESKELQRAFLQDYLRQEFAKLPESQKVFAGSGEFLADGGHRPLGKPRPIQILQRGEITRPLREVGPGTLSAITALPARFSHDPETGEAGRRAALARWLVHKENPLTWRSIVNRVWHYHFGRGLVEMPSDFGEMGGRPSHPELLDWLAVEFRDGGGSLKSLHRQIVLSDTYRQETGHDERAAQIDAGNRFLWRMNRPRLDAEIVRDALLQLSGRLDLTMGGPSDRQFIMSPGVHVTPKVDYVSFDPDSKANRRRSIYRFLFRTLPDPLMETMDCPAGDQLAAVRTESVTALQAFALLNNPFVVRQCEHIAARIESEEPDVAGRVELVFRRILLRWPTAEERAEFQGFVERHGLANVCRLLLNSNEFLYVD